MRWGGLVGLATAALFTGTVLDAPARGMGFELSGAPAGGWCWFAEPRALHHEGVTYFGYAEGSDGDVVLGAWDGSLSTSTLHASLQVDDHDDPALLVRDGYLWAFYSKHNDTTGLRWRRTTNPLPDISSWTAEAVVPVISNRQLSYAYPWVEGSTVHVIMRDHQGGKTRWWMISSTDDGATWSAPTLVYQDIGRDAYLRARYDGTKLHIASSDGHPELQSDTSIHHWYIEAGVPYASDGTELSFPVDRSTATLVYGGATTRSWVQDIATDPTGSPVIVFAAYPSTTDHRYRYATWDGDSWSSEEFAAAGGRITSSTDDPYYSGGIALDREDPRTVYASIGTGGGAWEMRRYIKRSSWTYRVIGSGGKHIRPAAVEDPGALHVLWLKGTYAEFTDYSVGTWGA